MAQSITRRQRKQNKKDQIKRSLEYVPTLDNLRNLLLTHSVEMLGLLQGIERSELSCKLSYSQRSSVAEKRNHWFRHNG